MIARLFSFLVAGLVLCGVALFFSNRAIERVAEGKTYTRVQEVPARSVALVLGTTSKVFGRPNLFYTARIDAAWELYRAGKVKHILVSGDNSTKYYNEPDQMKEDLMEKGVPENRITPDYAGLRTLDSVVRANKVFGQNRFVIVSQCFHGERGVYLATHHGIEAIAFCAADVEGAAGTRTYLREYLARMKAIIDVWILQKQPKHLGDKVEIEIDG